MSTFAVLRAGVLLGGALLLTAHWSSRPEIGDGRPEIDSPAPSPRIVPRSPAASGNAAARATSPSPAGADSQNAWLKLLSKDSRQFFDSLIAQESTGKLNRKEIKVQVYREVHENPAFARDLIRAYSSPDLPPAKRVVILDSLSASPLPEVTFLLVDIAGRDLDDELEAMRSPEGRNASSEIHTAVRAMMKRASNGDTQAATAMKRLLQSPNAAIRQWGQFYELPGD